MRAKFAVIGLVLLCAPVACATAAYAQVTVNPLALQQLAGVMPEMAVKPDGVKPDGVKPVRAKPVAARKVERKLPVAHVAAPETVLREAAVAKVPVAAKAPAPASASTPSLATVPKPVVAPAPKPAPVIAPLAPVLLHFAADSGDLSQDQADALKPLCAQAGQNKLVGIDAYAPADGANLSTAMRLSLIRAMSVRDALTACGVPASHIVPRADGTVAGRDENSAMVSLGAPK